MLSSIAFQFSVWFRKMRFKDGFWCVGFFGLLFFFYFVVFIIIISLCVLLCVSYLLHARFCCFFCSSISRIFHFTSQLYIQHTQKARSQYQLYNGIFQENWTQTTIRFVIFKQQRRKKIENNLTTTEPRKKGSNSIVVSRWRIIIISIVIIHWIRKISFNSHWIERVSYKSCIHNTHMYYVHRVFWLEWVQNSGFNCSQLSTIVLVCVLTLFG